MSLGQTACSREPLLVEYRSTHARDASRVLGSSTRENVESRGELDPPTPASSERALHPDVCAAVVVVGRDVGEAVGAVEIHRGGELGLRVETQRAAAEPPRFVEAG